MHQIPRRAEGQEGFGLSTPAPPLYHASDPQCTDLPAWKQELNQRLREHRERRGVHPAPERGAELSRPDRASGVAARVAERYREAPSYRELLQASAAAAEAAAAAAQQASVAAEAALSEWERAVPGEGAEAQPSGDFFAEPFFTSEPAREAAPAPLAVEHHAPLPARPVPPVRPSVANRAQTLVDAFAEAIVPAAQSLPAKLIEFPRELIATRKQRPRLAEGPLLDSMTDELSPTGSLRIFEVEVEAEINGGRTVEPSSPERASFAEPGITPPPMTDRPGREPQLDAAPATSRRRTPFAAEPAPARREAIGWGAIQLGAHPEAEAPPAPATARRPEHGYKAEAVPALEDLAPVSDRFMAALVDSSIVGACFLVSVLVFASCTVHPPAGKAALAGAALFLGVLATFYGWLFMSFGGGSTPGMRYARIALCTFNDENPTRRELQGRIPATALALLPLGLGILWALLDEDRLGWQDRMTRTYQRSYR